MTKPERSFVTIDSFDGEEMLKLFDSPFGHWASLLISTLTAASLGASSTQLLAEKLESLNVPDEEIRELIGGARCIDMFKIIRSDVGAACINTAVREWNADVAGLNSDKPATGEPSEEITTEINIALIRSTFPL